MCVCVRAVPVLVRVCTCTLYVCRVGLLPTDEASGGVFFLGLVLLLVGASLVYVLSLSAAESRRQTCVCVLDRADDVLCCLLALFPTIPVTV